MISTLRSPAIRHSFTSLALATAVSACAPHVGPHDRVPGAATDVPGSSARPEPAQDSEHVSSLGPDADLSRFFGGVSGTLVLLDARTGRMLYHDPTRASARFLPASTFKVPHALIALETGVADGPDFTLRRDTLLAPRQDWWPAAWQGEHTLASALSNSVVWYYQEVARRIGPALMRDHLARWGYGNADIGGGQDVFWLDGALAISAEEQLDFVRRLRERRLGVSERSTRLLEAMLILEETDAYRLSGKTGWAGFGDAAAPQLGWLVGWVEHDGGVWYFAMNLDISESGDAAARMAITRRILQSVGALPP